MTQTFVIGSTLASTAQLQSIASLAEKAYTLLILTDQSIELNERDKERMVKVAQDSGAAWLYADHYTMEGGELHKHPVIDMQEGALRNDFDFGAAVLVKTKHLKDWAASESRQCQYAGLYQLRLYCQRTSELFHLAEYMYTVVETDLRKSGEKQFDYVNPAQRAVQIEMEQVCTDHLKDIGAYLPAGQMEDIDFGSENFEVEVSVIIPVYNRARTVADAVRSVLEQQADFKYNIIVVNNHSTDGTAEALKQFENDTRVVVLVPERLDFGIGGCWDYAVCSPYCGKFAIQLDSDDIYSGTDTLQRIVDAFYQQKAAMIIGSYKLVDFSLNELPPGVIDHKEWTDDNGRNNALRINGLGAPRAFYTPLLRKIGFPNTSYGEDYALGLAFSRQYRIGRIYDVLYLCRRWEGNSDAALDIDKQNRNNYYKDQIRTIELKARKALNARRNAQPDEEEVNDFFNKQLQAWPEVNRRFAELEHVEVKQLKTADGVKLAAQYNAARIVSTGAKIDSKSIKARKCFLCEANQPAQQNHLYYFSDYQLCVNPFPILPRHFTLPSRQHTPQKAEPMLPTLLATAAKWSNYIVFYNGALCGASAPDHAHLQLGAKGVIPLQRDWSTLAISLVPIIPDKQIYLLQGFVYPLFAVRAGKEDINTALNAINTVLRAMPLHEGELEARFNLMAWSEDDTHIVACIIPRSKHRPDCYSAVGEDHYCISPGSVDMGGLLITPIAEDFHKLTADRAQEILREVACSQDEINHIIEQLG